MGSERLEDLRDVIAQMKDMYDRSEGQDDIREVLQLERSMKLECDRRETDARAIIRGETTSFTHNKASYCWEL